MLERHATRDLGFSSDRPSGTVRYVIRESESFKSLKQSQICYDTKICPIFEIIRDRCKIPRLISFESTVGMDYSSFVSIGVLNM